MLKRRDGLLASLHRHLSSLAQFLRPVQDLELATSLLLADLQQTEAAVLRAQIRRSDIVTSIYNVLPISSELLLYRAYLSYISLINLDKPTSGVSYRLRCSRSPCCLQSRDPSLVSKWGMDGQMNNTGTSRLMFLSIIRCLGLDTRIPDADAS